MTIPFAPAARRARRTALLGYALAWLSWVLLLALVEAALWCAGGSR